LTPVTRRDSIEAVICPALLFTIPITLLAWTPPREQVAECSPDAQVVVASIQSSALPSHVLARAKHIAATILASADLCLQWAKPADAAPLEPCGNRLDIVFKDRAGSKIPRESIAVARVHPAACTEPEIEIFLDRICQKTDSRVLPQLLGHVLAHEIVHVLQGTRRHSHEGLMKPRWSRRDILQMVREPLKLTPEDVELIHARLPRRGVEEAP
jgi:hypothetical protein